MKDDTQNGNLSGGQTKLRSSHQHLRRVLSEMFFDVKIAEKYIMRCQTPIYIFLGNYINLTWINEYDITFNSCFLLILIIDMQIDKI